MKCSFPASLNATVAYAQQFYQKEKHPDTYSIHFATHFCSPEVQVGRNCVDGALHIYYREHWATLFFC